MALGKGNAAKNHQDAAMKCQKCTKPATLHITEVLPEEKYEELHLCEECANKYLYEPQKGGGKEDAGQAEGDETSRPESEGMPGLWPQVCRVPQFRPPRLSARLPGIP